MSSHTAGIIVIGDEILKGQVVDTNSHFLCQSLHSLGIKVCKISVVGDDVDEIASEVSSFSQKYSKVFTSGGVGPASNDVTYLGVARAFNRDVEMNKELATILLNTYCVNNISDIDANPALKMAQIPQLSTLIDLKPAKVCHHPSVIWRSSRPVVTVNNVYMFPGTPKHFEYAVTDLEYLFKNPDGEKFYTLELYLRSSEMDIIPVLNHTIDKFKGSVVLGSYPQLGSDIYLTKVVFESMSSKQVEEAHSYLRILLPARTIVDPFEEGVYSMVEKAPKKGLSTAVTAAVKVGSKVERKCEPKLLQWCLNS